MDPKMRPLSEGRWNAKMEAKWEQGAPKGNENGNHMNPWRLEKSIWVVKPKNQLNASQLAFSWVSGVQVEM